MTLSAQKISKTYDGRTVLSGVDIHVPPARIVGLLGPSGSGKSTTFGILAGFIKAEAGQVFVDDQDVTNLNLNERARLGIGYVPQTLELFHNINTEKTLRMALQVGGYPRHSIGNRVSDLIHLFDLTPYRNSPLRVLSGGQYKIVEVAFALACDPTILLLDEPFVKLDPLTIDRLVGILRNCRDAGTGMMISSHNIEVSLSLVDEALIINDGQIIAHETPKNLKQDETIRRTLFGAQEISWWN